MNYVEQAARRKSNFEMARMGFCLYVEKALNVVSQKELAKKLGITQPGIDNILLKASMISQKRLYPHAVFLAPRDSEQAILTVQRRKAAFELARSKYRRALKTAINMGVSLEELAEALDTPQESIARMSASAIDIHPGFSGGTAYEIVQRYVINDISRDELISQLSRWHYTPMPTTDGIDGLITIPKGSFDDTVGRAWHEGLITDEIYSAINATAC